MAPAKKLKPSIEEGTPVKGPSFDPNGSGATLAVSGGLPPEDEAPDEGKERKEVTEVQGDEKKKRQDVARR